AGQEVAQHYNRVLQSSIASRAESRAFYLRNFNNWVKSVLIGSHLRIIERQFINSDIRVLDLCSGKGGDLLKWRKGGVAKIVFVDIADVSVEQCRRRYGEMAEQHQRDGRGRLPRAEFHVADATAVRLRDLQPAWPQFHLVSCQFSLHYCFQSYQAARQFVRNACESLLPGGYFIGTLPDANEIVRRLRRKPGSEAAFGNGVYNVTFSSSAVKTQQVPLFGCKYHFSLEKQVQDCPEYLVYFPVLEQLCSEYGLRCTLRQNFAKFYRDHVTQPEWRSLLGVMQSLEPYPNADGVELKSQVEGDYRAAQAYLNGDGRCDTEEDERDRNGPVGTLSMEEWEAATLYMVFAFQRAE
ncbi:hypothetical protein BOX15_Mlig024127g3, partial [Macrostomum lignano]